MSTETGKRNPLLFTHTFFAVGFVIILEYFQETVDTKPKWNSVKNQKDIMIIILGDEDIISYLNSFHTK